MSLFNKPKRNIRRRPFNDEDEDNENRMEVEDAQPVKVKTKKKDKPKQTLLSFGEELEQGIYTHCSRVKHVQLPCMVNLSWLLMKICFRIRFYRDIVTAIL